MSISPVTYSKSGNGEVIHNGSTQETHHIVVRELWNYPGYRGRIVESEVDVRYAMIYSREVLGGKLHDK